MTKRDSVCAGFDSPRNLASMQRRQFTLHFQPRSGAASSEDASSSAHAMSSWDHHPNQTNEPAHGMMSSNAHPYGYTSEAPPVPLPPDAQSYPQGEAYPLQAEIQQQHRVLHTHIFKEVVSPHQSGRPNRLMVTEVDCRGFQRNRQPEFFFNGIVGHVRADNYGNIDSWAQATQLANYWRRYFNIPKVHEESASWQNFQQPSDNADRRSDDQEELPASEMEDSESVTANIGTLPVPSQIHQLATVLHNILNSDRESNAAILEKLENPDDDLSASPIQVFGAADLAHLASHLAYTSQVLARQAQEMEDLSDIDD